MSEYYDERNLERDLKDINKHPVDKSASVILDRIGKEIGYGRAQQILQILWAKDLKEQGSPAMGALLTNKIQG